MLRSSHASMLPPSHVTFDPSGIASIYSFTFFPLSCDAPQASKKRIPRRASILLKKIPEGFNVYRINDLD